MANYKGIGMGNIPSSPAATKDSVASPIWSDYQHDDSNQKDLLPPRASETSDGLITRRYLANVNVGTSGASERWHPHIGPSTKQFNPAPSSQGQTVSNRMVTADTRDILMAISQQRQLQQRHFYRNNLPQPQQARCYYVPFRTAPTSRPLFPESSLIWGHDQFASAEDDPTAAVVDDLLQPSGRQDTGSVPTYSYFSNPIKTNIMMAPNTISKSREPCSYAYPLPNFAYFSNGMNSSKRSSYLASAHRGYTKVDNNTVVYEGTAPDVLDEGSYTHDDSMQFSGSKQDEHYKSEVAGPTEETPESDCTTPIAPSDQLVRQVTLTEDASFRLKRRKLPTSSKVSKMPQNQATERARRSLKHTRKDQEETTEEVDDGKARGRKRARQSKPKQAARASAKLPKSSQTKGDTASVADHNQQQILDSESAKGQTNSHGPSKNSAPQTSSSPESSGAPTHVLMQSNNLDHHQIFPPPEGRMSFTIDANHARPAIGPEGENHDSPAWTEANDGLSTFVDHHCNDQTDDCSDDTRQHLETAINRQEQSSHAQEESNPIQAVKARLKRTPASAKGKTSTQKPASGPAGSSNVVSVDWSSFEHAQDATYSADPDDDAASASSSAASSKNCSQRRKDVLWTPEEDEALTAGLEGLFSSKLWTNKHGKEEEDEIEGRNSYTCISNEEWEFIVQNYLGGKRNVRQCRRRWARMKKLAQSKPPPKQGERWTAEEDETLRLAVLQEKHISPRFKWSWIARKYFNNTRSSEQCRTRWNVRVKHPDWTAADDALILSMRDEGKSWSEISKCFPSRPTVTVQRRWMKLDTERKLSADPLWGGWTSEEMEQLVSALSKAGTIHWKEVEGLPHHVRNSSSSNGSHT